MSGLLLRLKVTHGGWCKSAICGQPTITAQLVVALFCSFFFAFFFLLLCSRPQDLTESIMYATNISYHFSRYCSFGGTLPFLVLVLTYHSNASCLLFVFYSYKMNKLVLFIAVAIATLAVFASGSFGFEDHFSFFSDSLFRDRKSPKTA
jgi:hypothetical protein